MGRERTLEYTTNVFFSLIQAEAKLAMSRMLGEKSALNEKEAWKKLVEETAADHGVVVVKNRDSESAEMVKATTEAWERVQEARQKYAMAVDASSCSHVAAEMDKSYKPSSKFKLE